MRVRWRNMELPVRVVLDKTTATGEYGKFVVEPFERGYGETIGNSLRRVLLSSLEGAAPVALRIDGVSHEFSSIPGIREDVTDIVLNVKGLLVKLESDEQVVLKVEKKGEGPVTAGDLQPDSQVEVVNPDLVIATIAGKETEFSAEITVRKGRGYVTAEELTQKNAPLGVIYLDAMFSPVRRARYACENTRVGQKTNYDRLVIELWTDGTVDPEMALVEAATVLRKHFNPFVKYYELGEEIERVEKVRGEIAASVLEKEKELQEKFHLPISVLDPSVRAENCLDAAGINTVGDLVSRTESELLKIPNFGKTSMNELKRKLADMGLELGISVPGEGDEPAAAAEEEKTSE